MITLADPQTRVFLGDLIFRVANEQTGPNPPFVTINNVYDRTQAVSNNPATVFPILPIEIIDNVCQRLAMHDITNLVRANSVLNVVGTRRLYHTIGVGMLPARLLQCMISLDHSADLPLLIRTFEVNLFNHSPTRTYYLLLERVLKKMVNLTTLVIELPQRHSPTWVLPTASSESSLSSSSTVPQIFRLRSFTTSMHCKSSLARFLDSQSEITELTLRGINSDSFNPLFPFITLLHSVGTEPSDHLFASLPPSQFTLLPTSLPKLSHFDAIHAGPTIIRDLISSRPVTHVSTSLFPPHTIDTLSALSLSSKPLMRLTVMSFDPAAPHFLFPELSIRFTELETLYIVVLMVEVTATMLLEWGVYLSGFKKLRYITFMATLGGDDDGQETKEEINERKIAKVWHSSCPTLKTVILPQGKVWFHGNDENSDGDWKCLNYEDERDWWWIVCI